MLRFMLWLLNPPISWLKYCESVILCLNLSEVKSKILTLELAANLLNMFTIEKGE